MTRETPYELEPLFYTEAEVAELLSVHRTTVRQQAKTPGTALNACVFYLTPSTRRYPREAIHRLAEFMKAA